MLRSPSVSGANAVQALLIAGMFGLVNGAVGVVIAAEGMPISVMAFTITGTKIVAIDIINDPGRIAEADLAILSR